MERRRKTLEELNLLDDFLFNAMLNVSRYRRSIYP